MKKGTSLYLDLVRFSAALAVFAVHLQVHAGSRFSPFWRFHLNYISQTAITVFFVLSGYVIAHVLATREKTLLDYTASRFGRLYSVVLPALILTAACNYLITLKYPDLYRAFDRGGALTIVSHYGATALFLNSFWLWPDLQPPNAGLFWSLSFEATYYAGIAFFVFARGRVRVLGLVALAVAAGSTIVLLAATWILGFWAYHFSPRQRLRGRTALILWLGSTALLFSCFLIEEHFRQPLPFLRLPDHRLGAVMAAYAAAACFAFNLVAFDAISEGVETFLAPFTRVIRWLGSMTFALYLFHYPLLALLTAYGGAIPPSLRLPWLIGGTFVIVATLGHLCERSKDAYKKAFLSTWRRVNATPALVN